MELAWQRLSLDAPKSCTWAALETKMPARGSARLSQAYYKPLFIAAGGAFARFFRCSVLTRTRFEGHPRLTAGVTIGAAESLFSQITRKNVCEPGMIRAQCRGLATKAFQSLQRIHRPVVGEKRALRRFSAQAQTLELQDMGLEGRILAAQAFASNALNRSTLERRDVSFIEQALPHASILLVSGRVSQRLFSNEACQHRLNEVLRSQSLLCKSCKVDCETEEGCAGNKCSVRVLGDDVHRLAWHSLTELEQQGFHRSQSGLTYSKLCLLDGWLQNESRTAPNPHQ